MILKRLGSFVYRWAWRFYEDGCLLHASALAYTTMLSIVPVLALMFAALKGLGVESELEELLLERLSLSQEVVTQITAFVARANVGTLGTMGPWLFLVRRSRFSGASSPVLIISGESAPGGLFCARLRTMLRSSFLLLF